MRFLTELLLNAILLSACNSFNGHFGDARFARKIADNIQESSSSRDNLWHLTKVIGGRMSGTLKMTEAEEWGIEALKKAGADTMWMQPCEVAHWERRGTDSVFISYIDDNGKRIRKRISALALGRTTGTGRGGLKAKLIRFRSFEALDSSRSDASGKIVFFNPRFETGASPGSEYGRLSGYRTRGAIRASACGATGVIMRSLTNAADTFPHIGMQVTDKNYPSIPAAAVSTSDANLLDRLFDEGKNIDIEMYTYGRVFPDTTGHNIIGEIKGNEFPDRYITIGAHLDSWDMGEGASDDGTGVVIAIEVLRALKSVGYKPKNTIRFVLFADEENGIHGGTEYAKTAAGKKEHHLFAMESDAGTYAPLALGTSGFSAEAREKLKRFSELFRPYVSGDFVPGGAADISPLSQSFKIPVASLLSDQKSYFSVHHSPADTFENADTGQIKNGAISFAILLYLVEKYDLR